MAKEIYISSVEGLEQALTDAGLSVKGTYADIAALLADQANQVVGDLFRVTDASADANVVTGSAYYDYTGAETADLGDYFLVSAPESASLTDGVGTTANGTAVDIGGGSQVTGERKIIINGGGSTDKLLITTDQTDAEHRRVHTQQNIVSFFSTATDGFGGMGLESQGFNYPAGSIAGFYMKDLDSNGFGAGMYATPDGYITIFQGALRAKMRGLRFSQDFADIDWATDLAADGLLIPHQARVQAMIDSGTNNPELNKWYVSLNGHDTNNNGSPQKPFLTIQKAIDSAVAGDTIFIDGGQFSTAITIDKDVRLVGIGSEDGLSMTTIITGDVTIDNSSSAINLRVQYILFWGAINDQVYGGANVVTLNADHCEISGLDVSSHVFNFTNTEVFAGGAVAHNSGYLNNVHFKCPLTVTTGNLIAANSALVSGVTVTAGNFQQDNTATDGTVTVGGTHTIRNQSPPKEVEQTLTVTDANYTAGLVLNEDANVIEITLDAALTNDWAPSSITGWVAGRNYTWFIVKASDNGVDLTTARAVPNVGYDDDIDPFADLIDIDTTQQRAVINAIGFKSTFGQFGRLIITDSNYAE